MDFNIDKVLAASEPVLAVRQVTTVDTTALVTILRQLGQKIEQQDAVIRSLHDEVEDLRRENAVFRANAAEYARLKSDVAGLIEDVESITMYAKLPKVPNRARDGILRSYMSPNDTTNLQHGGRGDSEPTPSLPEESRYNSAQTPSRRNIVVASQMAPSSAGISRTGSSRNVMMAANQVTGTSSLAPITNSQQGPRPRTGLTMEADPDTNGLRVTDVKANSAAAEAGIRPDDIIVSAEGHQTLTTADFIAILDTKRVGDYMQVEVIRNDVALAANLKLKGKQSAYTEDV